GSAIIQTDITEMIGLERAERERLLDDQARMVRATLDHMDEGVAIFDAQAQLVGWNTRLGELLAPPMRLVRIGVRFEALFSAVLPALTFDDVDADGIRDWVAYGRQRPPLRFEVIRVGRILKVFAQETPDRGFVMSFTDITPERRAMDLLFASNERLERRVEERTEELNDALAEAQRANATKSRFVAAASHDIQQPISAAKHFLATLSAASDPELVREASRDAQNALGSVEDILDDLLAISMLDAGGASPKIETLSVAKLFDHLGSEFRIAAEDAGLRLRFRPTDAFVQSDSAYLTRILRNLISNAIRYTRTGGILVAARRRGGGIAIQVLDTGIGIPLKDQKTVFQEFARLDGPASAANGLGLGLAIVERASDMLGHRLRLSSVPGQGSLFEVLV
ncbi:MAG: PAS-domain containing protein, partial [Pseudomonadota bacterium]